MLLSSFSTGAGFFCCRSRLYSSRLSDLGLGSGTVGASLTAGVIGAATELGAAAGLSEDTEERITAGATDESSSSTRGFGVLSGCWELTAVGKQLD